ncbi:uncharacterized protein LOC130780690 [Actinidia eriantha]|uniref:uncharacterized protein LOC130780690 n=1 Tax=Actinidia eriantha TaxID=165200 RepID=UPI002584E116|nr:uncharacterized protein LOC130780690 [Actinidia eriantha]
MHEVHSGQPAVKKSRQGLSKPKSTTFIKADLKRVQYPYSDPLVIQLQIYGYDVKRILVDSGSSIEPLGIITLKVRVGSQELETECIVVDIPSPYNAIVERDWLHKVKGIASILHQIIKFATPKVKETLDGDQVMAYKGNHEGAVDGKKKEVM